MRKNKILDYMEGVLKNMPNNWVSQTTHRLDIYNEKLAKIEFLKKFEVLYNKNDFQSSSLTELPTAFDYIRLGHPLSCLLEWVIAKLNNIEANSVISFSSKTIPILAILRKNLLEKKKTQIIYLTKESYDIDFEVIKYVYEYDFEVKKIKPEEEIPPFKGTSILISKECKFDNFNLNSNIDFLISTHPQLGSVLIVNGKENQNYISEIQHVRRRETIAMTPTNSLAALKSIINNSINSKKTNSLANNKSNVIKSIKEITGVSTNPLIASSGLSIQYAILMGLIHDAKENHTEKKIKIIVPTNCYGGTNDQARRIASCIKNVEVLDLVVDNGKDMVKSIDLILNQVAFENSIPYIIAEIPTNPRVQVPDLLKLKTVLTKTRKTSSGKIAIDPVFILDQTFCPNIQFLAKNQILSKVRSISYASGSKFASGGLCTSGYCIGNIKAKTLMKKIEFHLKLCDNEATELQIEILAKQLPSMNERIYNAYKNTREFVNFINKVLPKAKINFVSKELSDKGFTPSVFSIDLPTKGNTKEEKDSYKKDLNHKLINLMITKIPYECKYCVSYGQLNGSYWTIPATSTQGTTKESDKDYITRVAISGNIDIEIHKKIFLDFTKQI